MLVLLPARFVRREHTSVLEVVLSSDLSVSPGRRTGQFYVPDHQERIKEFRERCLVPRAKSATLAPEEVDRAPRVPLHISRVPELITPKEVRLGEDACCTAGLRDPARLLDRWPSMRECWRPIRYGIVRARARLPDCVVLTTTCGERPWRTPPSEESIAMVRAAISTAMGLTVVQEECHHAASTLRLNLFRALAQLTKDPDAHVANWLESGAPMGIESFSWRAFCR